MKVIVKVLGCFELVIRVVLPGFCERALHVVMARRNTHERAVFFALVSDAIYKSRTALYILSA